jgi:hypothetical protein
MSYRFLLSFEQSFLEEVSAFLKGSIYPAQSLWFRCSLMEVYLRTAPKYFHGAAVNCCTVANVEVYAEFQKEGVYSSFLDFLAANTSLPIFIENVHDEEQHGLYLRRGFESILNCYGTVDRFIKYPTRPPVTS